METHRQNTVAAKASAPKRQPSSLADVAERAAAAAVTPLHGQALRAERHRVRAAADALVGMAGA